MQACWRRRSWWAIQYAGVVRSLPTQHTPSFTLYLGCLLTPPRTIAGNMERIAPNASRGYCAEHKYGLMCATCVAGRSGLGTKCVSCTEADATAARNQFVWLLVLVVVSAHLRLTVGPFT